MKKWKPNKQQLAAWLEKKDEVATDFKQKIRILENHYKKIITINKNCNSIYFENGGINYRISTHPKIDKGFNDPFLENNEKQINWVTNSRENIIKTTEKLLKGK